VRWMLAIIGDEDVDASGALRGVCAEWVEERLVRLDRLPVLALVLVLALALAPLVRLVMLAPLWRG
jgi:hypothetical protein